SGPWILQSGGDGAGRRGVWSCSKGRCTTAWPSRITDQLPCPLVRSSSAPPRGPQSYFIAPESPGRAITYSLDQLYHERDDQPRQETPSRNVPRVDLEQTDRREQRCRDEREPGDGHGHGGWPRSCAREP